MRFVIDYPMKRLLSTEEAIEYCGMSRAIPKGLTKRERQARFRALCPCAPVALGSSVTDPSFDVRDLDQWIDGAKVPALSQSHDDIVGRLA